MKTIFLSCVSAQFSAERATLKEQFATAGIDLSIQEDFADAASPYGTLVKLYHFVKRSNMVVQLVGSHQGEPVRYPMVEELLRIEPSFKRWLVSKQLFVDLQDGRIAYTDFEAYLAIYLNKAFLAVRVATGAQPDHEQRLRMLGKHVNVKIDRLSQLLSEVQSAEQINLNFDAKTTLTAELYRSFTSGITLAVFCSIALALAFLFQLAATLGNDQLPSFREWLTQMVICLAIAATFVAMHFLILSDRLQFRFRAQASLRNSMAILLLASLLGLVLASMDSLFVSLYKNIGLAIFVSAVSSWLSLRLHPKRAEFSPARTVIAITFGLLESLAVILLFGWLNWHFDALYWLSLFGGLIMICTIVRQDIFELEKWLDYGTSDFTEGITQWNDAYFWYPRDQVVAAIKHDGFRTVMARPVVQRKDSKPP